MADVGEELSLGLVEFFPLARDLALEMALLADVPPLAD